MSVPHHSDERSRILHELFAAQANGTAKREFPHGRMCDEDDGALAYMIATDVPHGVVRIKFPKPITEIGLDVEAAEKLRDALTERLFELRGIR